MITFAFDAPHPPAHAVELAASHSGSPRAGGASPARVTAVRTRCPDGVLVIDKTRGPTSHDAVACVRRALGVREVGHAGTLDPMATGVLVVALGQATKLVPWLTEHAKTYRATIALGVETDTLDADGREVRRVAPSQPLRDALASALGSSGLVPSILRAALDAERARRSQTPPAFSAIRQGGERAYARARRGDAVELPARDVIVHRLDLAGCREEPPSIDVVLDVGKGYYVRSLGRDLAAALGTVGHLTSLRRTRSGCFTIDEACAVERTPAALRASILPLATAATRALPAATLTVAGARDAGHGRPVQAADMEPRTPAPPEAARGPMAWLDLRGELVAIGAIDGDGRGKVLRGFATTSGLETA